MRARPSGRLRAHSHHTGALKLRLGGRTGA